MEGQLLLLTRIPEKCEGVMEVDGVDGTTAGLSGDGLIVVCSLYKRGDCRVGEVCVVLLFCKIPGIIPICGGLWIALGSRITCTARRTS